jgi:nicotinate-nucleotide adenylyltransferase
MVSSNGKYIGAMMEQSPTKRRIGILGTSANPMHEGHVQIGKEALFRLKLDEVLFMVTPHSPHKDPAVYAALEHRTHLAHLALMSTGRLGNRFKVSDFEASLLHLGEENSTANMLAHFVEVYPSLQPVWLMGADSLATLHTWGRWQEIIENYPVAVLARDCTIEQALGTEAGQQFQEQFVPEEDFVSEPGTWTFLDRVSHSASSTQIREQVLAGRSPQGLSGDAEAYIRHYGLYGAK